MGSDLITKFNSWKKTHGKSYETADHEAAALAGFSANEAFINEHNSAGHSYQVGHNEFSDMTFDEFT